MLTGAEALVIPVAISTLISGFAAAVELIQKLRKKWRERHDGPAEPAELETLERTLLQAKSTVQGTYDAQYQRYGQRIQVGDDLARYILFALAARQEALVKNLHVLETEQLDTRPLISKIEKTKTAATSCLVDLAARTERPGEVRLTFQQKAALLRDYQNLCPSAARYRDGTVHHSQLGALSNNKGKLRCHECGASIVPTKLRIPEGDASSCVLITISGLFRAHCHTGGGWTCIWQPRTPSCFGVFKDEKSLLKHMLAAHFRDDGEEAGIKVDWVADVRRGDLEKCGFMVQMNGMRMRNLGGNLVVPRQLRTTAMSTASQISVGPASTTTTLVSPSASSTTLLGELDPFYTNAGGRSETGFKAAPAVAGPFGTADCHEAPAPERFEMFA